MFYFRINHYFHLIVFCSALGVLPVEISVSSPSPLRHKKEPDELSYPFNTPYPFFSSVFRPTSFTTVLCAAPAITCPICICIITL